MLVGAVHQFEDFPGRDLPGKAVTVLQPASGEGYTAFQQLFPVIVDLLLGIAAHHQGNRLVELELRPAIESDELLAPQAELNGHHGTGPELIGLECGPVDFRFGKNRNVVFDGFLRVAVEPEKGGDWAVHAWLQDARAAYPALSSRYGPVV